MAWRDFYENNRKIIIVIVVVIVIFIIYRYMWQKKNRMTNLERNLGFAGQHVTTNPNSTLCLTADTQKQIANDINKKLQEINACDCSDTCGTKTPPGYKKVYGDRNSFTYEKDNSMNKNTLSYNQDG